MRPRLQAMQAIFSRPSGDSDAQGDMQNGAATAQGAGSQERSSSESSAITGTTARSPAGTESSGEAVKQSSMQKTISGLYHDSWDFEKAEENREASANNYSTGARTLSQTTSVLRPSTEAGTWSFAVMDYNDLDAEFDLPVTGSRGARWYASTFHCVTAMVGAGVLALPYALSVLGWGWGITGLSICWLSTLYSLWQLCFLHERDGKRFNRYHEVGQYCFGPRLGLWIVVPFQLIVMVGLGIVYCRYHEVGQYCFGPRLGLWIVVPFQLIVMVGLGIVYVLTAGLSLHHVWRMLCSEPCTPFGLSAWIAVFGCLQLFLSQMPNFNALRYISFVSALMSVVYSTLAIVGSAVHEPVSDVWVDHQTVELSDEDKLFFAFAALGTLSFAYGGHNVVLEIQATLPTPPSSFPPMMHGVYVAYAIVAYCYFGVAIAGYTRFRAGVSENIMFSIGGPPALLVIADLTIAIHMCGSFQIYSMPVFDMIETVMVHKGIVNTRLRRLGYRSLYVVCLCVAGAGIPYFGDILAVVGAIAYGPTTFLLPSIMYLWLENPGWRNLHFAFSWANITVGTIVTVLGTIGGIRNLAQSFSYGRSPSFQ